MYLVVSYLVGMYQIPQFLNNDLPKSATLIFNFEKKYVRKKTKSHSKVIKVRSFAEHRCAILSSIKIMIIFNNTSADIKTKSADVLLKIIIILLRDVSVSNSFFVILIKKTYQIDMPLCF